ncbi:ComEA family DNA-binding protein [Streptomyces adustus]|uniref:ComEA family DNA-binding protein n=1 Tax=Streptomyces adustus TaxID=1609272 RepID=A0A5N8VDI0_9ACTN|nr:ComEA family DNA-binding protein [Streptomyces adustus]MPY32108.1 ComEA family DNA-binding protein [Streptomyces adustus]
MALRSRSHAGSVTSGPGRGPASDVRARHRRSPARSRSRHRHTTAQELRRRAQVLFADRTGKRHEPGTGPPDPAPVPAGDGGPRLGRRVPRARAAVPEAHPETEFAAPGMRGMTGMAGMRAAAGRLGVGAAADSARTRGTWRERVGPALRERMPVWLQTRCGLERRNVVALTVVLVVAAGFAVQHFWTGRPRSVQAPETVRAAAPYGARAASGPTASGTSADSPGTAGAQGAEGQAGMEGAAATAGATGGTGAAGTEIVVDVSGKVRDPGIHRLPAGSRVVDALRAAGGVRPGTSTDGLNRARFLVDGEQVVVGGPAPAAAAGPGTGGAPVGGPNGGALPAAPVSLNTATVEQLDALPGVGPVLARHILDYRGQHGGFRSVDELRDVNGIGDRRFADLRNLVRP